jgi:hypothetical protein
MSGLNQFLPIPLNKKSDCLAFHDAGRLRIGICAPCAAQAAQFSDHIVHPRAHRATESPTGWKYAATKKCRSAITGCSFPATQSQI